jgi:hypothetical protein
LETTADAVAVNVALFCPAPIFTLAGTVTLVLLLASATLTALGAAKLKVTVQMEVPGASMVKLAQFKLLRETDGTEMEPVPPLEGIETPLAVDATTPVSWIGIALLEGFGAIWNVATATGPSPITVALKPIMRQLFPEQERLLPALVVDVPATTVTPVMSDEKLKVHWNPAA